MQQFWIIASYVALLFASLITTALVITYTVTTQWDKTQVGRQFMLTKACLALVLDYWAFTAIFISPQTSYVSMMPVRTIICMAIGIVMLRWLIILIRAQLEVRSKRNEDLWS
jgi:hypothetical protein